MAFNVTLTGTDHNRDDHFVTEWDVQLGGFVHAVTVAMVDSARAEYENQGQSPTKLVEAYLTDFARDPSARARIVESKARLSLTVTRSDLDPYRA